MKSEPFASRTAVDILLSVKIPVAVTKVRDGKPATYVGVRGMPAKLTPIEADITYSL
jgi:hypothetical protein